MGERAFCSRNSEIPYAHISDLDLGGNPVGQLNACILRQMWKGLSARNSTQHRAKLSFKEPVPGLQRAVKCECNVTISTVYVEMEGECERAGTTRSLEELDKFHCDSYKHREVQLEDVEAECDALIQYDCTKFVHDAGMIHPAPPLSSPPNEFIPKTVQSEETAHDNQQLSQERTSLLVHKTASNSSQQIQTTSPSPQPKQFDREIVASDASKQSKEIAQGNGFAPRLQPSIYMFFAAALFSIKISL